jgi:serine/threonine-protein kinase
MNSDVLVLFREVADRSPLEREEYYVQQRVPAAIRAEVESLLRFDGETDGAVHGWVAAEITHVLDEPRRRDLDLPAQAGRDIDHPTHIGRHTIGHVLPPGTRLAHYVVGPLIGAGGMGEVYRARDSRLGRNVALKILAPGVTTPEQLRRFEHEARAASSLNHPNILTIYDVGDDRDVVYIAMEWVDGHTLRQLLNAGPVPLDNALTIAAQIAEGLAKAHAGGIVHRDLKPENVMITVDGLAKIVDFGIAKLGAPPADSDAGVGDAPTSSASGTQSGVVVGTVGYMSPEQAGGGVVDYRSDQFALGLLIYELVTGTRPFERSTTAETLAATIECDPLPIAALWQRVAPQLAAIVSRCLAKDPPQRYESTSDLARELKAAADTASTPGVKPVTTGTFRWSGRAVAAAALALVAAVAAGSWLWQRGRDSSPQPAPPFVVVRPFQTLSTDASLGYFAAGVTEEIRGQLSQISSLRLLSRNALDSVKDADPGTVARALGVTNFVDGSVRVDGNRVRVTAELSDATTQITLWSNHYDRDLADMLAVQSDIALQIAGALHASLSADERQRLQRLPTENAEAYALLLRAQPIPTGDRAQNLAAIELLRTALALDPSFALARSRLAYRLVFMGYYDDPSYVLKGIAEAEAAIATDPSQPNAYVALATGYMLRGLNAQARQAYLRTLELDPNHVVSMYNLSLLDGAVGRLDDSLYWGRRGFGLSGRQANDFYHVAVPLINIREDELAHRWLIEAEHRFPASHRIQATLAITELMLGQVEAAMARASAAQVRQPQNEEAKFLRADMAFLTGSRDLAPALAALMDNAPSNALHVSESIRLRYGFVLGLQGSSKATALVNEAERIAREKVDQGDQSSVMFIELAAAAVLKGQPPDAIEWLSRAYDAGYRDHVFLERDPILAPLRREQRFGDLLERMRQDVAAQRATAGSRGLLEIDSLLGSTPAPVPPRAPSGR